MPAIQVMHAAIETALNPLLQLDSLTPNRLHKLSGKRLILWVEELAAPIEIAFEQRISLHQCELSWEQACERNATNECRLKVALSVLPELQDSRQLTRLIREHKLDVDGDIHIAQQVSSLVQELNIDWEEVLSGYIGDIAAHQSMQWLKQIKRHAQQQQETLMKTIGSALVDEKELAAHQLQVIHFSDQVSQLRDDVGRLAARISRLEEK